MKRVPLEVRTRLYFQPAHPDACWPWTGCVMERSGYGLIGSGGTNSRSLLAHRVVYELLAGSIPEGMHLDHTCHSDDPVCRGGPTCMHRRCVNPAHLEPVDPPENGRRVPAARRNLCPYGHQASRSPTGDKYCKRCEAARQVVIRAERKAGLKPEPRLIACSNCHQVKPLCARELCRRCYTNLYRQSKGKMGARPGRYKVRQVSATEALA